MKNIVDEKINFLQRQVRNKDYALKKPHAHEKNEMYYLEKGSTEYFIGNEIYILDEGDFIFVPKRVYHKNIYHSDFAERLLFVFDDDFVGEDYSHILGDLCKDKLVKIPQNQQYRIKNILNAIEHENKQKCSNYEKMMKLYFKQLLIEIDRLRIRKKVTKFTESQIIVQNCAKFISQNYGSELSLDILAKRFAVSSGYLSKLFKKNTGLGINEYINISRVSEAEKKLEQGGKSITEIASECGFNDSNYFASVFKKIKGITPKKYSLQNKNG